MKRFQKHDSLIGAVLFFVTISVVVTVSLFVYELVSDASEGNRAVISGVMLAVILVLSAAATFIDYLRRRRTVDEPVKRILEATDKIAEGDFSVRLEPPRSFASNGEFAKIMVNLNRMAAELSRTEVLHTDFVANVSHEIKTPLSVIRNYAVSLQRDDLDRETRAQYVKTLVSASEKLTVLVTNILKLNKIENQQLRPEYETVNLSETFAQTLIEFEDAFDQKELTLECDIAEDVTVYSVPNYLELVWNNLLSNAVKFTERGGNVTVTLKKEDGNAVVRIADTGCGISAETGKHIFEKFYQGDTSHSGEGNGLGLALVKKVIDKIGGSIFVESEPNKGTTFTIVLRTEEAK